MIGLSANTLKTHKDWIKDIKDVSTCDVHFPIIADKSRKIAYLYDMIDYQDTTNVDSQGMALTTRAMYFIDPKKIIRAIIYYPASTGRNSEEVLRVIDSLQLTDKYNLVTPVDWKVIPPVEKADGSIRRTLSFMLQLKMRRQRKCFRGSVLSSLTSVIQPNQLIEMVIGWSLI